MTPVVLVTFAGRQKRMEVLTQYIRQAMQYGIIDEWHIWDFTRNDEDHAWVTREFGPVRLMGHKVPYQLKGPVSPRSAFRTSARIEHDLHIAVIPNGAPEISYEIVVGGWKNTHSVLRKIPGGEIANFDRADETAIWARPTPGVLSSGTANQIFLSIDAAGAPALVVNDVLVGRWPELDLSAGASVFVRGGWGAELELLDVTAPVRRYIGNPKEPMPYWQAYDYYSRRLPQFSETLFLKCDDDVVYLDVEKLGSFIEFRRANPKYFIVSANVVNNGICAYWQQIAGSIPASVGDFERPPGGFGGSLWTSAVLATRLHEFFLAKEDKRIPLTSPVIDWTERQSINFISWLGKDLVHMSGLTHDDEDALSVRLPTFLDRPTAIYSDFVVSHLSFEPQEPDLDLDGLIGKYEALMRTKTAI
jgi:hypothetical protein